ncbi:hypothetical protein [Serratia marcescens]|uniref:hypothetical protein n=1 Tax=Serratia marcescens TaxID=615 RepID=UPI000A18DEAE|nr:hypothetical protein [Serratia marcescens]
MTIIEMIKNLAQRNRVVASADVLAVFRELEAKDKRIAELEYDLKCVIANNKDCEKTIARKDAAIDTFITECDDAQKIIAELKAKLATPVRLPTTSGRLGVAYTRVIPEVIESIRAAGFKVEGDE